MFQGEAPKKIEEVLSPDKQKMHYEIALLRVAIQKILSELRPKIERGTYQLVVGDDASGRIPTLIFERVIKELYEEKGFKNPEVRFIAGGIKGDVKGDARKEKIKKAEEYFKKIKSMSQKEGEKILNALVVTDTIETGGSLEFIANALKNNGIKFDIATIALILMKPYRKENIEKSLGGRIVYGQEHDAVIYGSHQLSGVEKDPKDLFSKPVKNIFWSSRPDTQKTMNQAREDVKILSEDLVAWYKAQE